MSAPRIGRPARAQEAGESRAAILGVGTGRSRRQPRVGVGLRSGRVGSCWQPRCRSRRRVSLVSVVLLSDPEHLQRPVVAKADHPGCAAATESEEEFDIRCYRRGDGEGYLVTRNFLMTQPVSRRGHHLLPRACRKAFQFLGPIAKLIHAAVSNAVARKVLEREPNQFILRATRR